MASKTITRSSSTFYTIYVTCTVNNDYSATQASVAWSSYITFGNWYQWGVRLKTYVNGVEVGNKAQACTSSGQTICSSSGTAYIDKTSSAQTINFSATSSSETVSGYGGVGSSYTGTASGTFTVNAGGPAPVTSCTLTESTKDSKATFSWVASGTITNQEWAYQKNGEEWVWAKTGNGTTRSVTFNLEKNSQYRAYIQMENGTSGSPIVYSNFIYTTPEAPIVTAVNTGSQVIAVAKNHVAPYYASNVWQVSTNGGSSYSALSETGPVLTYTVSSSATKPIFRCAIKNIEGDQSAWTNCTPVKKSEVFLNVPSGSLQGIYINA